MWRENDGNQTCIEFKFKYIHNRQLHCGNQLTIIDKALKGTCSKSSIIRIIEIVGDCRYIIHVYSTLRTVMSMRGRKDENF